MAQECKRVAAIHDMSSYGRCSLSVILPVMSCLGVQCCPVPTAVFSTHTGGFSQVAMKELSPFLSQCLSHWQREQIRMDCIYSGFLASHRQAELVEAFFEAYPRALKVVDPVMGDGGKPYRTCGRDHIDKMRELAARADVITPNPTEAALLLDLPFPQKETQEGAVRKLLALSEMGPGLVIITGLSLREGIVTNLAYDKSANRILRCDGAQLSAAYHGTGDIFASIITAELVKGCGLQDALEKASWFVAGCIDASRQAGAPLREGVCFERVLPRLTSYQQSRKDEYFVSTEIITDF